MKEEQRNQVNAIIHGTTPNDNLVRMLEKAHEKRLDNLTTNLTETLSSSLSNFLAH